MSIRPFSSGFNGIQLRNVLPEAHPIGIRDLTIRTACGRWDECQQDDLYVALVDPETDGHEYACQAIERGATAVVSERLLPISTPQFIVEDSRIAYAKICQALAGSPSQRISTISVAGTVGKTVTSHLIHSILSQAGLLAGISSSITVGTNRNALRAMASSAHIADHLSRMVIDDCTHAVIEVPAVGLAHHAFSGLTLDAAVWTNLPAQRLDLYGNPDNYFHVNARLADYLKPTGFAIVNADDRHSHKLLDQLSTPTLTFGIHSTAEVTAKLLDRCGAFQSFLLSAGNETIAVRTRTIGKTHVYNCLAAAATALAYHIPLEWIAAGLETAQIPGRLDRVDCGQEFGVWIDASWTPMQLNGAISSVAAVCQGKLWCLCSTNDDQTPADRRQLGEILARKTDHPLITQSGVSGKLNYEPYHQILDGFDNPAVAEIIPDRCKAIEWALAHARPGDVVLITGNGERPTHFGLGSDNGNGKPISDRQICEWNLSGRHSIDSPDIYRIDDYR